MTTAEDIKARTWARGLADSVLVSAALTASDYPRRYTAANRRALLREAALRLRTHTTPQETS